MDIERRRRSPSRIGGPLRRPPSRIAPGGKSRTPLIVGGVVAGALLLILILTLGSSDSHPPAKPPPPAPAKPVDVSSLERDGLSKCDQGLAIIQNCEGLMTGGPLSDANRATLRKDLERGRNLILEGTQLLEEANRKTGGTHMYDVTRYNKAQKAARDKLRELGGQ